LRKLCRGRVRVTPAKLKRSLPHGVMETSLGRRILSGQAGFWASPVRGALAAGEVIYTAAINARNQKYDSPRSVLKVSVPVISVGNITVGGTGKTPFVIELVRRLHAMGRNPVVVARGYGGGDGEPGDEELLVRKNCPGAAYVADADRHRGAELAVRKMGADVIVLDDAFQHRRLHRDLDIVLIDALCPFGYGHVLPRGLLREPLSGLKRAHLLIVTRSDQVARNELDRIESQLREHNSGVPIVRSNTKVLGVEYLDGAPIHVADKKRVLAFAAIGRPQAFASTLSLLGFDVVATRWWPDHHKYRHPEIMRMLDDRRLAPHDLVLTTEKDAVKLALLDGLEPRSIGVVRIGVEMQQEGGAVIDELLEKTLGMKRMAAQ
jgi:tetraacyldisaccharide 4'-kinase